MLFFGAVIGLVHKNRSSRALLSGSKWLTLWHWLFNLSLTAVFFTLVLKWPDLLLRLRLAVDNSIFQSGWLVLLVMTLLLLLTATVHEIGHLLAGYLVRFRFQVLVVGPLRITGGNGRLRWQRQRGGALFNGLAASLPDEMENLARRLLYFALGGPLASLLLSVVALAVVLYLGSDLGRMLDYLWLWECCLFTAIVSYFFLLTSLRPGTYHNGMVADGGRILMVAAGSPEAERWQALVKLNVADLAGERPFQWDEALLRQSVSLPDNSHDYLTGVVMNYHHWLDKNEPEKASVYLEEALNSSVAWETGMRTRLVLEKAFLAAAYLQDLPRAREALAQVKVNNRQVNSLFWRAKAAIHLLAGDAEDARETAVRGIAAMDEDVQTGLQKAELAWLNGLITKVTGA
ncbi:MAG: hypothetical protein CL608_17450 [Anaerolineaceae bacterium]|nr:hypothetical protein [Anaerolineaceae bacterium]